MPMKRLHIVAHDQVIRKKIPQPLHTHHELCAYADWEEFSRAVLQRENDADSTNPPVLINADVVSQEVEEWMKENSRHRFILVFGPAAAETFMHNWQKRCGCSFLQTPFTADIFEEMLPKRWRYDPARDLLPENGTVPTAVAVEVMSVAGEVQTVHGTNGTNGTNGHGGRLAVAFAPPAPPEPEETVSWKRQEQTAVLGCAHPLDSVGQQFAANYFHDHSDRAGDAFLPVDVATSDQSGCWKEVIFGAKGHLSLLEVVNAGTVCFLNAQQLPWDILAALADYGYGGHFQPLQTHAEHHSDVRVLLCFAGEEALRTSAKLQQLGALPTGTIRFADDPGLIDYYFRIFARQSGVKELMLTAEAKEGIVQELITNGQVRAVLQALYVAHSLHPEAMIDWDLFAPIIDEVCKIQAGEQTQEKEETIESAETDGSMVSDSCYLDELLSQCGFIITPRTDVRTLGRKVKQACLLAALRHANGEKDTPQLMALLGGVKKQWVDSHRCLEKSFLEKNLKNEAIKVPQLPLRCPVDVLVERLKKYAIARRIQTAQEQISYVR